MESVSVSEGDVASVLMNDASVINEWRFLYHHTDPRVDKSHLLQVAFTAHPDVFCLLKSIVGQWVEENGARATVQAFANILRAAHRIQTEEVLLAAFPPSAVISHLRRTSSSARNPTGEEEDTPPIFYESSPDDDEVVRRFENLELQRKTKSGGVTILELMPSRGEGRPRVIVFVNFLLNLLALVGDLPVAIISINGKQRTGKSFLANQFIKYLKRQNLGGDGSGAWLDDNLADGGFNWAGGVDRVTSGIQVWHEPLYVNCDDGKEVAVIVLDTQGLHDKNTGTQENALIFGLSTLLSSVFIYNDKETAEDSLQHLRSFLEFAKFASASDDDADSGMKFQKLILLLRDWQNPQQYPYGYYDDDSQMEPNLKRYYLEVTPTMHEESRETRRGIANCFESIAVNAMCGPGNRPPNMCENSRDWDPLFRQSIRDFVTKLFSKEYIAGSTKRVFEEETTGSNLIEYVSQWATMIQNAEGALESKTIVETTAEIYYNKKIEECLVKYKLLMSVYLRSYPAGVDDTHFHGIHQLKLGEVLAEFSRSRPFGGAPTREKFTRKLTEMINGVKADFVQINQANLTAEAERQRREQERLAAEQRERELQRQRQAIKDKGIATAQHVYNQALGDLKLAEGKRDSVVSNRQSYKSPVNMKKRNRVLGVVVSPTKWVEWQYDDNLYQAALRQAIEEINVKQQRLNEAEQSLAAAQQA